MLDFSTVTFHPVSEPSFYQQQELTDHCQLNGPLSSTGTMEHFTLVGASVRELNIGYIYRCITRPEIITCKHHTPFRILIEAIINFVC